MGTKKTTTKKTSVKKSVLGTPLGNPLKFFREGGNKTKAMFKHGGYNVPKNNLPKKFMGGPEDVTPSYNNVLLKKNPENMYINSFSTTKRNPLTGRTKESTDITTSGPAGNDNYGRATNVYNRKGEFIKTKYKDFGSNKPRNYNKSGFNSQTVAPGSIVSNAPYPMFTEADAEPGGKFSEAIKRNSQKKGGSIKRKKK